jgi:hypothetical protein
MKIDDTFIPSIYPLLAKAYMALKNRSKHSGFLSPSNYDYHVTFGNDDCRGCKAITCCNCKSISHVFYEGLTCKIEVDFNRFYFSYRHHSFLPYKEIFQIFHKGDIGDEKKLTKENFLNCLKDFGLNLEILSYLIGDN